MAVESKILNIEPIDLEYVGIKKGSLDGKVAVITGGVNNIGLGYSRAVAWAGAKVVVSDINEENGNETQRVINEETNGDNALFVKCDVTKDEEIKNLARSAIEKFGKVDILIHNAMNMTLNGELLKSTISDMDQSYAISARGFMLLAKEFVPAMIERKYGVVAYSATQFHYLPPMIGKATYTGGKAAAASLAMSLANEVKDTGVNVFCLTPAGVNRRPSNPNEPPVAATYSMPGFEGWIPPEVGGAAMVYSILNSQKIHGSGIIVNDALDAMKFPYPKPETAVRNKLRRLSDMELTMAMCNMGKGFDE